MNYTNPILYMDLSDPDVIRDGAWFYMTASSFTYVPGLPVLRSRDLAHWELIGYAADRLPAPRYDRPAHGCGIWAPSIRKHHGLFYIYACMPDEGLFAWTAEDPAGPWTCHLVKQVTGWIDPCPLFTEEGVFLVHGFAASRVGINNLLYVHRLSDDGLSVLDKGRRVYDGADEGDITVEGPKFYHLNGYYWILCPAGGVKTGYQLALRSRNILGPYERKVVLSQGDSPVNGPHQGALFNDGNGRDWFIHFQDVGPYGRIPHLQPVVWQEDWPVMGRNGTPVSGGDTGLAPFPCAVSRQESFPDGISLPWQWQSNPSPAWFDALRPGLRLYPVPDRSVYETGAFLSRLMTCRNFDLDVTVSLSLRTDDRFGLCMMGAEYTALEWKNGCVRLLRGGADKPESKLLFSPSSGGEMLLRMQVREGMVSFLFGEKADSLQPLGDPLPMSAGGWTGARPGVYCLGPGKPAGAFADIRSADITEYP